MGGRHGAALFCVANCDFGFAANCAGAANCASTSKTNSKVKIIHKHNKVVAIVCKGNCVVVHAGGVSNGNGAST